MIKIVGLGNKEGELTLAGVEAVNSAKCIIIKTAETPTYKYFQENGLETITLDFIYRRASNYQDLDTQIVDYILSLKQKNIVYCVNGAGYDDTSVALLKSLTNITIIPGIGKGANVDALCPATSSTKMSATTFLERAKTNFDLSIPLVIYEIDNKLIAQDVKLKLAEIYSDEQEIIFCNSNSKSIPLYELDRQHTYDYRTSIVVEGTDFLSRKKYGFGDLLEIIRRLRDPDGCHWDREQTHSSIRSNAIEEAYELAEAVDLDDIDKMIEESGDVLLQAVLHSVIAEDSGEYTTNDMLSGLCHKLISRHTHIFGENKANNPSDALKFWELAKAVEKGQSTINSKVMAVPVTFGALMRAFKVQKIIKKSGFNYSSIEATIAHLHEEIKELLCAKQDKREGEAGDVLFSVLNVLHMLNIDPELALTSTINKFIKRFKYVEDKMIENNFTMSAESLQQMDVFYHEYKRLYEDR